MQNETSTLSTPISPKKSNNHEHLHSTISEKMSSEENSEDGMAFHYIIDKFEEFENLNNFILLRENEEFGEIDFELALTNKDETFRYFEPCMRKTSFFYMKNRESIAEKINSLKNLSSSYTFDKEKRNSISARKGSLSQFHNVGGNRRASQMPLVSKNSKNERIESLVKIQSDIMNKMFKKSEKSYNFMINGLKYQFAENSLFLFNERSQFRLKTIKLFKSKIYKKIIFLICIINLIAFLIYDYIPRIGNNADVLNKISWFLDLLCTIIFTIDFFIRIIGMGFLFGKGTLLKSFFGSYYICLLLASWIAILPQNDFTNFCLCIRLLKNNRIIVFIDPLKKTLKSFLNSLLNFLKTYLSLISLMIFYSILGLHLLKGMDENRCRMSETPINNTWPFDETIKNFCGEWECPAETFCINPSDYGFMRNHEENEIPELNYGLTNFNTIFNSFFTVLHFIDAIGWTSITYNYWKAMNQFASALFFTSLFIFGALIFMNILLATLYEGFVSKESIKNSLEKKIKKQVKTKDQVNVADLSLAKTLKASPSIKTLKHTRISIDEEAYQEQVNRKLNAQKEKIKNSNRFKHFIITSFENQIFRFIMYILVITDLLFLSFDRYPINHSELKTIYLADFIIFIIFLIEIILRIITYGFRLYFLSFFNCYDFLIIFMNLNQYIYEFIVAQDFLYELETQTGPIFRILKLTRIFRVLYYSTHLGKLSILTKALFKTLHKIKYFVLFVTFIAITSALIGLELFAYRLKISEEGHLITPRINYDNFYKSFIGIILGYYNEDWNIVMYETYMSVGESAIIFYSFLIIIGQMTIITLLKALILNYFIKSTSKEFFEHDQKLGRALTFIKSKMISTIKTARQSLSVAKYFQQQLINPKKNSNKSLLLRKPRKSEVIKPRFSKEHNNAIIRYNSTNFAKNKRQSIDIKSLKACDFKKNSIPLISIDISKENFGVDSPRVSPKSFQSSPRSPSRKKTIFNEQKSYSYQKKIFFILSSKYYHYFMFLVTLTSMFLQILDSKFDDPESDKQKIIFVIDRFLGAIYLIEFLMNVVTHGLILGENSYLRQSFYNKLDFCNVVITICDFFANKHVFRLFQSLKIVRTFRILKIATKTTKEIQIISKAFIETLPNLLTLIIFFSIFLMIFSLVATKYMKGTLFSCENYGGEAEIMNKWDCFDLGGDWIDQDISYNNVLKAMLSLFQISSCQGWTVLMEKSIDGKGIDEQPVQDYNTLKAVFFLVFFFISNFILLNMFVGILIENIIVNKNKARGFDKLNEEQKEWAIIKANILKISPKPLRQIPEKGLRKIFYLLLKNKYINIFFDVCIILNLLVLMSYFHRQSTEIKTLLDGFNYLFIVVFTIENLMKLLLDYKHYFKSKKILYEACILIMIWIDIIVQQTSQVNENHVKNYYIIYKAIVKGMQATRIYRIFKRIQSVKQIYDTLFHVLPTLLNMLLLIILILYMYAIVGMDIFSYLKPQSVLDGIDMHFRSFPISFFTLIRVASSESWFLIFSDAVRQIQSNFVCVRVTSYYDYQNYGLNDCGSYLAYPYFLSFHILFSLVILNLFVAIVLTQYDDEFKAHQSAINKYQLHIINKEWRESDPHGDGYINYKDFWRFASKISKLLDIQQSVESKKKFLKLLRIPVYENAKTKIFSYKFHDVIIELSKMSVLVNYGVMNLDTEEDASMDELDTEEKIKIEGFGSKKLKNFIKTQFLCGDMSSIILISKLIKTWVKKAKKQYDSKNHVKDIFDLTKAALKRAKTLKLEEEALKTKNDQLKEEENHLKLQLFEPSEEIEKKLDFSENTNNKYNNMNEVTVDDGSTILSQNRSIDLAANSKRGLLEEVAKRRTSILKNTINFGEGNNNNNNDTGGSPRKKFHGKKIQFMLD